MSKKNHVLPLHSVEDIRKKHNQRKPIVWATLSQTDIDILFEDIDALKAELRVFKLFLFVCAVGIVLTIPHFISP